MKRLAVFTVLGALLLVFAVPSDANKQIIQQTTRLNNQDVIDWVRAGMSDEVIIEKIRVAPETSFDTNSEGWKALKAANVSDAVIKAMVNPKNPVGAVPTVLPRNPSVAIPGFPNNASVAYKHPDGSFTALDQCPAPNVKSTGGVKTLVTQGISSIKAKAVYRDAEAPVRIAERRPTFYLRSNSARGVLLVRLEKKGHNRELEISGGATSLSMRMGIRNQDILDLTTKPIADGILSIIPNTELPNGEYLIAFDNMGASSFDFGIVAAK